MNGFAVSLWSSQLPIRAGSGVEHSDGATHLVTAPATANRDSLAALLTTRLLDARELQWRCVWVGRRLDECQSLALTRMFDDVYGAVAAYADLLSERICELHDGDPSVARGTMRHVPVERVANVCAAQSPVDALADVLWHFTRMSRDGCGVMTQLGDPVSASLLREIADVSAIWQWALASGSLTHEARVPVAQGRTLCGVVSAPTVHTALAPSPTYLAANAFVVDGGFRA